MLAVKRCQKRVSAVNARISVNRTHTLVLSLNQFAFSSMRDARNTLHRADTYVNALCFLRVRYDPLPLSRRSAARIKLFPSRRIVPLCSHSMNRL